MRKKQRIDFRDQVSRNKISSFILMSFIFLTIILLGYVISLATDPSYFFIIMIIAIIFSIIYIFGTYYNSDKIAIKSVSAKKADKIKHKEYYSLVESLTIASGLPMPRLYVMESPQINAFATGRDPKNAAICVTEGALEKLEKKELEGVLAHELAHIANFDVRYMTIATIMIGMIAIISQIFLRSLWFRGGGNSRQKGIFILIGIILAILAPLFVQLAQLAISRKREYSADATAVKFTRYPQGLIGAFKKIKEDDYSERKINKTMSSLFIANPLKNLKSTHPPLDERIKILEKM